MYYYKKIQQAEDDLKLLLGDVRTWEWEIDPNAVSKQDIIKYIEEKTEEKRVKENVKNFLEKIRKKTGKSAIKKEKLEDLDDEELQYLLGIMGTDEPGRVLRKLRDIIERTKRIENVEGLENELKKKWNRIEREITYTENLKLRKVPKEVRSKLIRQNKMKNNDILRARIADIMITMYLHLILEPKKARDWKEGLKLAQNPEKMMRERVKPSLLRGVKARIKSVQQLLDLSISEQERIRDREKHSDEIEPLIGDTTTPEQEKVGRKIDDLVEELDQKKFKTSLQRKRIKKRFDASKLSEGEALQELDKRRLEALELTEKTDKSTADYKRVYEIYQELGKIGPKLARGPSQADAQRIIDYCLKPLREEIFSKHIGEIEKHYKTAFKKAAENYNNDEPEKAEKWLEEWEKRRRNFLKKYPILTKGFKPVNWLIVRLSKEGEEYEILVQAKENWINQSEKRRKELAEARIKVKEVIEKIKKEFEKSEEFYKKNNCKKAKEHIIRLDRIMNAFLEQNKDYKEILKREINKNTKETYENCKKAKNAYDTRKENNLKKYIELMKKVYNSAIEFLEKNKKRESDKIIKQIKYLSELLKKYPDEKDNLKARVLVETKEERKKYMEAITEYDKRENQRKEEKAREEKEVEKARKEKEVEKEKKEKAEKEAEQVIKKMNTGYDAVIKLYNENNPEKAAEKRRETANIFLDFLKNNKEHGESLKPIIRNGIIEKGEKYKQAKAAYLKREKSEPLTSINLIKTVYKNQINLLKNNEENANEKLSIKIGPIIKKLLEESDNKQQLHKEIVRETETIKKEYEQELDEYNKRKRGIKGNQMPEEDVREILASGKKVR